MNTLKKIVASIILLVFTAMTFVGCSFFELDVVRFRNDPVAVTKSGEVLVRTGELIDAFNSYGYQLVQEGQTTNGAMNKTLELLINRKIILKAAAADGVTLDTKDKQKARKAAYGYINDALLEIEEKVRVDWDRTIPRPVYPDVVSYDAYSPYQPAVRWVGSDFEKVEKQEEVIGFVPNSWQQIISDADISAEALNRLSRILRTQRKGMGFENKTNLQVIEDEINKSIKIEEENIILQKFQDVYDRDASIGDGLVLDCYSQLVASQYKQWLAGTLNVDTFTQNMISNNGMEELYYVPSSSKLGKDFFTVTHILIKLDEKANERINENKAKMLDGSMEEKEFIKIRDGEAAKAKAYERYLKDEHNEYITDDTAGQVIQDKNPKLASEILAELQYADADTFRDYIYTYGEDPGMFNNRFGYVMSSEKDDNTMIAEFTEECLALYERSKTEGNNLVSNKLIFTEIKEGEYGVHIIFFDRNIDFVNIVNITELSTLRAKDLYDVKISSYTEESIYHVIRSKLTQSNYPAFEQEIINQYRNSVTVKVYTDKIKSIENQK